MSRQFVSSSTLPHFQLWERIGEKRVPLSFTLEVTARCNNDCRHCYVNLPAGDREAKARELTREYIRELAREAVSLGALWCLLTGGEPLLRDDFAEIYLDLKRLGLLVSVFTNACLVTREHLELFRKYPPRDLEVTVYGVTPETYEAVSRGLDLLRPSAGASTCFWTAASRYASRPWHSGPTSMNCRKIARFCRERTGDYYRFDPLLHIRCDGKAERNEEIKAQRLTPEEIVALERADTERWPALQKKGDKLIASECCPSRLQPPLPLWRRPQELHGHCGRHLPALRVPLSPDCG